MKRITMLFFTFLIALLLASCSDKNDGFAAKSYTADGTQVKAVQIDVRDRKIEISVAQDDRIHLDYYENEKEYYDISITDGNKLCVTMKTDKEWSDYIGGKIASEKRSLSLQVPGKLLESLELSTSNEDIRLPALTVTDHISISGNNSNITFERVDVGSGLTLKTKNGNISGTVVGSCEMFSIACDIKKGKTNLPQSKESGTKDIHVTVNNGDANIEFTS